MGELTVISFDMTHGLGTDGTIAVERVAHLVAEAGADLAGLQEIDRFWPRSYFENQAAVLGRLLGMHHLFAPITPLGGPGRGLAILSRHPVLHHTWHRTAEGPPCFVLQRAAIGCAGARVTCLNTNPGNSPAVWRKIQGICRDLHTPALLTGGAAAEGFAEVMRAIGWRPAVPDEEPVRRPLRDARPQGAVFFSPHWRMQRVRLFRPAWAVTRPLAATAALASPAGATPKPGAFPAAGPRP